MKAPRPRLAAALLGTALLLAAAPPAAARSPSSSERGSLDWLLARLARDRDEEKAAPVKVDPVEAYAKGTTPLDDWKALTAILQDGSGKTRPLQRERAVGGLLDRFRIEDERKAVDGKALEAMKRKIFLSVADLIVEGDDSTGRNCVHRLQMNWFPQVGVPWNPADPPAKRAKALRDLKQKLSR
jgi:hypothetical protein